MKKIRCFIFLLGTLIIGMPIVKAECSIEETNRLTSLAYKVNANFEVITKELPLEEGMFPPDGFSLEDLENYRYEKKFFKIYISNITEDIYVVVKNDKNKTSKTYHHSDTNDNVISFEADVTWDIINYTITVYAAQGECTGKILNTISFTTPMYNKNSEYAICDDIKEYYLCKEYISVETSFENFFEKAEKYKEKKFKKEETKEEKKGISQFIKEHKGIIIITSIIIITAGGLVTVIIVKKQRSKII